MTVFTWHLRERSYRPAHAIQNATNRFHSLPGLYLQLHDQDGRRSIGEASPLPEYSPDDIEKCRQALTAVMPRLPEVDATCEFHTLDAIEKAGKLIPDSVPAARFALETALLDRLAQSRGVPLGRLFSEDAPSIAVNGLLDAASSPETIQHLFSQGIRVFKLKVGQPSQHAAEMSVLSFLRSRYGRTVEIRLDANGAFSKEEALSRMREYTDYAPTFIEEPTRYPIDNTTWPIAAAADESLIHSENHALLLADQRYPVWVLKPSLLGGWFKVRNLTAAARAHGKKVIITHMFESLPGFLALIHLAASLGISDACGLFPHIGLGPYQHSESFLLANGHIWVCSSNGLGITSAQMKEMQP